MKRIYKVLIIGIMIFFVCISCSQSFAKQEYEQFQDGLNEDDQPVSTAKLNNTFTYSPDQIAVRQEHGNPTRFTIIFNNGRRHESWHFDTDGYTVAFIDGVRVSEKHTLPEYKEEMYATTLSPDQFDQEMGIDEILLSTGQEDTMVTSFDGAVDDNQFVYLEGLSIGLIRDKVSFIETYPAMTERKLNPEDFNIPSINDLTPEEIANEGLHEYLVVHFMDDELVDSYNTIVEVKFAEDKVCISEKDETYCFLNTAENEYVREDEGIRMYVIPDGFYWYIEGEGVVIETLFSRVDE